MNVEGIDGNINYSEIFGWSRLYLGFKGRKQCIRYRVDELVFYYFLNGSRTFPQDFRFEWSIDPGSGLLTNFYT